MKPTTIQIGNHVLTQVSKSGFEIANQSEMLDFYLEVELDSSVTVFVFDSSLPNNGTRDPFLANFSEDNLGDAVNTAMALTKPDVLGSGCSLL